ncbi:H-NS histone family protein, partial [Xanthomonas graminis]
MRVAHYLTRGETGRYYVRLRIPVDLQARFGRKVVKRSTGTTCDRAALGYALLMQQRYARAFAAIRNGSMGSELDELLRSLEGTSSLELILKDVKLPGGASFGQVEINDDKDLSLFKQLAAQHSVPAPAPFPPRRVVKPIGEARSVGLTLADARDKYLVSIQGKNTAKTLVQKTRALKDLEVFVASQRKAELAVAIGASSLGRGRKVAPTQAKKEVTPKYWLPHTHETWSGRGRPPRAFKAWEDTVAYKQWKASCPGLILVDTSIG